ncbi:hypothetical protein CEUSTIGMA_g393.t1 [Chlamydomonas eustigma]|uniref:Uncharacterized protein n=1 Tax=Chlamydomonas eustigma TaxID=1157962 RepID=A0A250WQ34_9CHLO|nr:hypothetical protein CEUSTIGMA_g393.t1 [Chlamydomonas eustigma]|eukprot:GAX72938.1 hypothetical protein CEUSTIGMA_g393.t1 [Chlamydomonas eustigma]
MMLEDHHVHNCPLLINMCDPELPFFQGLQRFHKLALMANLNHDRMVPYRTAAISSTDPYECTRDWYGTSPSLPAASDPQKYRSIRQPLRDSSQTDLLEEDQVPVRGKWFGLIVLTLLPLLIFVLITVLIIMVIKGRRHYQKHLDRPSSSWLLQWTCKKNICSRETVPTTKDSAVPIVTKFSVQESSTTSQDSKDAHDDTSIKVVFTDTMSKIDQQEWMVEQLNRLPWQKVDVDVRHIHAHAGIVVRIPERFTIVRDHLPYLFNLMDWP